MTGPTGRRRRMRGRRARICSLGVDASSEETHQTGTPANHKVAQPRPERSPPRPAALPNSSVYCRLLFILVKTMRRNYGSLNLAALDLSGATVDPSFHDATLLTHELAHLEMVDYDDCASSVGFPMESLVALMEGNVCRADVDALSPPLRRKRSLSEHGLHAEIRAASSVSSTSIPISSLSTTTSASPTSAPVAVAPKYSNSYTAAAPVYEHQIALDLPPRLVEQHHIELNALRCLSLKMMLSASSVSASSTAVGGGNVVTVVPQPSTSVPKMNSFEFDMGFQPQSDRIKTALLATRRGSLPRNMIQSV